MASELSSQELVGARQYAPDLLRATRKNISKMQKIIENIPETESNAIWDNKDQETIDKIVYKRICSLETKIKNFFKLAGNNFGTTQRIDHPNYESWKNVTYTPGRGLHPAPELPIQSSLFIRAAGTSHHCEMAHKILALIPLIRTLIRANKFRTVRYIFYKLRKVYAMFGTQATVRLTLYRICDIIGVPTKLCHIAVHSRGSIVGNFSFVNRLGERVSARCPIQIPSVYSDIQAENVILLIHIEHDSLFSKLVEDQALTENYILFTGSGFPDVATLRFIKDLTRAIRVPKVSFVDGDPAGLAIFFNLKFGSKTKAWTEDLAIPDLQFLGVTDADMSSLPLSIRHRLSKEKMAKINHLLRRPYLKNGQNQEYVKELIARKISKKGLSLCEVPNISKYIRQKIATHQWV